LKGKFSDKMRGTNPLDLAIKTRGKPTGLALKSIKPAKKNVV
jgi:hypothetical protein